MGYLSYELREDEELLLLERRHPWTLAAPVAKLLLVWIPLWLLLRMVQTFSWGRTLLLLCILASIVLVVYELWVWLLNVYLLTDQRLVDIHQRGAFRRTVTEIDLPDVAEVRYEINGPGGTFFRFGEVVASLEGGAMVVLEAVPRPQAVHDLLLQAKRDRLKVLNQKNK